MKTLFSHYCSHGRKPNFGYTLQGMWVYRSCSRDGMGWFCSFLSIYVFQPWPETEARDTDEHRPDKKPPPDPRTRHPGGGIQVDPDYFGQTT